MIAAQFYNTFYLIIVSILTIINIKTKRISGMVEPPFPSMFLCLFMILFIGFRPISYVFVDMMNYARYWKKAYWYSFDFQSENVLFDNLYNYMAGTGISVEMFFLLIASIYFGGMYGACRKLFPNYVLLSFLIYLAAFSTFTYGTNGIKAGAAASLFLMALAYRDKIVWSIFFLLLSLGFHHSMQLPVAAYFLTLIIRDKRCFFYGWLFCLLMAIAHISTFQELFAGATDERGAGYLNSDANQSWGGKSGFRLDFVIYSAMPVLMGYYVKYKYQLEDKIYDVMLNVYLVCNGVWMLCMYAQFTNRIAYLSWFMYPLLLIYPCLAINESTHPLVRNRNKIIMAHLGFTLFMSLIYYS